MLQRLRRVWVSYQQHHKRNRGTPESITDFFFSLPPRCRSKKGSHRVQKTRHPHQDGSQLTSNYSGTQWRRVTHLQTCALHPFNGSASSTARHRQMIGIKVMRWCYSITSTLIGVQISVVVKDFPGVEEICSEALKRQIRGIKQVRGRVYKTENLSQTRNRREDDASTTICVK